MPAVDTDLATHPAKLGILEKGDRAITDTAPLPAHAGMKQVFNNDSIGGTKTPDSRRFPR